MDVLGLVSLAFGGLLIWGGFEGYRTLRRQRDAAPAGPAEPPPHPTMEVTDSLGRKVAYRPVSLLEQSWMMRGMNLDACTELGALFLMNAGFREVDGFKLEFPDTLPKMERVMRLVGDQGVAAVLEKARELASANASAQIISFKPKGVH